MPPPATPTPSEGAPNGSPPPRTPVPPVPTLVEVVPPVLYFPPPLDQCITNTVFLRSKSSSSLAWRIRTTSNYRYSVKPTMGILAPRSEQAINIKYRPRSPDDGGAEPPEPLNGMEVFQLQLKEAEGGVRDITEYLSTAKDVTKLIIRCSFTPIGSPAPPSLRSPRNTDKLSLMSARKTNFEGEVRELKRSIAQLEQETDMAIAERKKRERQLVLRVETPLLFAVAMCVVAFVAGRAAALLSEITYCSSIS